MTTPIQHDKHVSGADFRMTKEEWKEVFKKHLQMKLHQGFNKEEELKRLADVYRRTRKYNPVR